MKRVLTIAGSDSGGGAGIQADLKTMTALGVFGMSALTALTAQNTVGVRGIHPVPAEFLAAQIDAVMEDLGADAAKTGMLFSAELIRVVADRVRRWTIPNLVIDPVMVAKSGHRLLSPDAEAVLLEELLPLAAVVTPNLPEAGILSGRPVSDYRGMRRAAEELHARGARAVIVKGGHLAAGADDILFDGEWLVLEGGRLAVDPVHGTGCTFSAALASHLALGRTVREAAALAKTFVRRAIAAAPALGHGHRPANHLFAIPEGGPANAAGP